MVSWGFESSIFRQSQIPYNALPEVKGLLLQGRYRYRDPLYGWEMTPIKVPQNGISVTRNSKHNRYCS